MNDRKYRVLLLEDDAGDARLLCEELKSGGGGRYDPVRCETLGEAVAMLNTELFDAVVTDLGLPDSRGLATLQALTARAPSVPIVVLTGEDDTAAGLAALDAGAQEWLTKGWAMRGGGAGWRQALRAGADDYLVRGRSGPEGLIRALDHAIHRRRHAGAASAVTATPAARGRLIGLLGARSGIGTSTLILNVAAALAGRGFRTAAIELDPGDAGFGHLLRQEPLSTLGEVLAAGPGAITQESLVRRMSHAAGGVEVLMSSAAYLQHQRPEPEALSALFSVLRHTYDATLVDLSHGSLAGSAALDCDMVVVVIEPVPSNLASARRITEGLVARGVGIGSISAVLVNRMSLAISARPESVAEHVGCTVLGVVPAAGEACVQAEQTGLPLVLSQPDHVAAMMLRDLADRLVGRAAPPSTVGTSARRPGAAVAATGGTR